MKRHRAPRPPAPASGPPASDLPASGLPGSYHEAVENLIARTVAAWWKLQSNHLTSEASHRLFEECFYEWLIHPEEASDAALVVRVARLGHPPADRALRRYVQAAMDAHRFPQLPLCVQEYAREGLGQAPLTAGYPSRNPLINNFARNVVLCYAMGRAAKRYPAVPLLYATPPRKSVAALVGDVFGLSEVQARRIYKADGDVALRIGVFFAGPSDYPLPSGPIPEGWVT